MEQKKTTTVKSKLGVEYTVTKKKAKELINKYGCEFVGGEKIEEEKEIEKTETTKPKKRVRRTKAEIEADKNK